jgi:hypothetical protein
MKQKLLQLFALLLCCSACWAQKSQPFVISSSSSPCAQIAIAADRTATVTIDVSGTFSITLQPQVSLSGGTAHNTDVTPSASQTPQATITAAGGYQATQISGWDLFQVCPTSYSSGSATITLSISTGPDAIASTSGGGSGTVTSVTFTGDGVVDSSTPSSAVTTSGTVAASVKTQTANTVLAGPVSGSAANSAFRALVGADLPAPSATTLGGVESYVAVSNQFINAISTGGTPSSAQPSFANLSGSATAAQQPVLTSAGAGYFYGFWVHMPLFISGLVETGGGSTNGVDVAQFVLPFAITVNNVGMDISATSSGATVNIGIYSAAGAKLIDSGTFSATAGGVKLNTLGTPVTLPPGVYYLAWSTSNATAVMYCYSVSAQPVNNILTGISGATYFASAANATSAGVMPSTLGTLTTLSTGAYIPLTVFTN